MSCARLLVAESLALMLAGCPFAMDDDYVVQGETAASSPVDAGSTPMDAGSITIDVHVCVPKTCVLLGAQCGTVSDGCGATLECGACKVGRVCGIQDAQSLRQAKRRLTKG